MALYFEADGVRYAIVDMEVGEFDRLMANAKKHGPAVIGPPYCRRGSSGRVVYPRARRGLKLVEE